MRPRDTGGVADPPAYSRHRRRSCQVCKRGFGLSKLLPASLVRDNIAAPIAAKVPEWSAESFICRSCLNGFRTEFVRAEMEKDRGELSVLEQEVVRSLREGEIVADNINQEFERSLKRGERVADKVAEFGGSLRWTPIVRQPEPLVGAAR